MGMEGVRRPLRSISDAEVLFSMRKAAVEDVRRTKSVTLPPSSLSSKGQASPSPGAKKLRSRICSIHTLLAFFIGAVVMFAILRQPQTLGIFVSEAHDVDAKDLLDRISQLKPVLDNKPDAAVGDQDPKPQVSWREQPHGQTSRREQPRGQTSWRERPHGQISRRELRNGEAAGQGQPTAAEPGLPAAKAGTRLQASKADLEPQVPLVDTAAQTDSSTQGKQASEAFAADHGKAKQDRDLQAAIERDAAGANFAAIQQSAYASFKTVWQQQAAEDEEARSSEARAQAEVQAAIQQAVIVSAAWAKAQQEAEGRGEHHHPASQAGEVADGEKAAGDQQPLEAGLAEGTENPVAESTDSAAVQAVEDPAGVSAAAVGQDGTELAAEADSDRSTQEGADKPAPVKVQVHGEAAETHDEVPQSTSDQLPDKPAEDEAATVQEAAVQPAERDQLMDSFMLGATLQVKEMDGMVILDEEDAPAVEALPAT